MSGAYAGLGDVMGQGLGDLISNGETTPTMLGINEIDVRPKQIRDVFEDDENTLKGLAADIAARGILQSLLVRPHPTGSGYELIAGERRWRAAQMAGLKEVPALIREMTDEEAEDAQAMENIQRMALSMVEEARKLQRDLEALGSRQAVWEKYGKSESWLSKRLALLQLPDSAKELITKGLSADLEAINNVAQAAKIDPAAAQKMVDQLKVEKPGSVNVREASKKLKDAVKPKKDKPAAAVKSRAPAQEGRDDDEHGGEVTDVQLNDLLQQLANHVLAEEPKKVLARMPESDKEVAEEALRTLYDAGVRATNIPRLVIEGIRTGHFAGDGAGALRLSAFIQGTDSESKFNLLDIVGAVK